MSIERLLTKTQNVKAQKKASQSAHQQAGPSHTICNQPSEEANSRQQQRNPQEECPTNGRVRTRRGIVGFLLGRFS